MSLSLEELCRVLTVLPPVDNAEPGIAERDVAASLEQLVAKVKSDEDEAKRPLTSEDWAKLVVVGAGHIGSHYWTNADTRKMAKELMSSLSRLKGYTSVQEVLAQEACLRQCVFVYLQGCWTRFNWRERAVCKQAFAWLLRQLKHPHVSGRVDMFLPPVLWMLDDLVEYNRLLALSLISHLLRNSDAAEMRWNGRAQVLYQAMKPVMHGNSEVLVEAVYSSLLLLLPVIDYSPNPVVPRKSSPGDEVFAVLLSNLSREPKLSLRRTYSAQVSSYIKYLGIYTIRHFKELLPVLLALLQYEDPVKDQVRRNALKSLSSLISACWPRISGHQLHLLQSLAKLSLNTESGEIHLLIVDCVAKLMAASPKSKEQSEYWHTCYEAHPQLKLILEEAATSMKSTDLTN